MRLVPAPLILFVYNRPTHTQRTIEALKENILAADTDLFIFSDAPKTGQEGHQTREVREYIKTITGFRQVTVIEWQFNKGVDISVRDGVSYILKENDSVIVVEDDVLTSKNFLVFMNKALQHYRDNELVWSIGAFNPIHEKTVKMYPDRDVYFLRRTCSWGWAIWKDRWDRVDWEKKGFRENLESRTWVRKFCEPGTDMEAILRKNPEAWDITHCYTLFLLGKLSLWPIRTKAISIGLDGSGTHLGLTDKFSFAWDPNDSQTNFRFTEPMIDRGLLRTFRDAVSYDKPSFVERIVRKAFRIGKRILWN